MEICTTDRLQSVGCALNAWFPGEMSNCVLCDGAFVIIFFKTMYDKTVIWFSFCDVGNNQGISKWYQPRPLAQLITVTLTLIIPDIKKALSNDYSIMPSFIYFGVQARGNGSIKGGHSNSTRDKWPCVFRTLLGMSTFDWNLAEILLSKTTKLFVCSKWQMTRKTGLRQRNLSTIFTGKSGFFIVFVTFLLLKCWHWFFCYTVHVVISLLDSVGDINL